MDWLRRSIHVSARLPLARRVYGAVYDAAVRCFADRCSRIEGVVSLLSRNSYASRTHALGLSDVDLVAIIEDDLDAAAIREVMQELEAASRAVSRRYPMIDDVPAFTRAGFATACISGGLNLEAYAWRCEWGDPTVLEATESSGHRDPFERLLRSLQVYHNGFHRNLEDAVDAGRRRPSLALERSAKKAMRDQPATELFQRVDPSTPLEVFVHEVLHEIDALIHRHGPLPPPHPWPVIGTTAAPVVRQQPEEAPGRTVVTTNDGLQRWVLTSPPPSVAATAALLNTRDMSRAGGRTTKLLTPAMFELAMRHLLPLNYYRLCGGRNVSGDDPITAMAAPSAEGIRRSFRFHAVQLLRIPANLTSAAPMNGAAIENRRRALESLERFVDRREVLVGDLEPMASTRDSAPGTHDPVDAMLEIMRRTSAVLDGALGVLHSPPPAGGVE